MRETPQPSEQRGRRPASGTIMAIILIVAILIVGGLSAWSRLGGDEDHSGASISAPAPAWSDDAG